MSAASRTIRTPSYFHAAMRGSCERHPGVADAERFKTWCDEYFYLKHRKEPRGIGGIFFDYLNSAGDAGNSAFDADFAFVRDVGESFIAIYCRHCPAQRRQTVERARARGATGAPRALRRVQPHL